MSMLGFLPTTNSKSTPTQKPHKKEEMIFRALAYIASTVDGDIELANKTDKYNRFSTHRLRTCGNPITHLDDERCFIFVFK